MDISSPLAQVLGSLLEIWHTQAPGTQETLWAAIGLAALLAWAWLAHRVVRRLAGHRRFRGRWFNAADYHRLMLLLWEDQQQGTRVMSQAELKALREYRYGRSVKPLLAGKGGGYFDG